MSRKITPEEKNILLNNPELVMFNPYSALKTHYCSLGKALILPAFTALIIFLWGFLFPDFINVHPMIFAGTGCAAIVIASGALPILYLVMDDHAYKKAKEEHYAKQLKILLPNEIGCSIAHVLWVTVEKAEGGWILDGKEEMFGYCSFVNYFKIEPDTDLAVISDGEKFCAFVKRDDKTESFYHQTEDQS